MGSAMGATRAHALDHVVLVIFENRSFDNLLGRLYSPEEKPEFEGVIGKDLKNPVPEWADPVPPEEEGEEPGYVYYGTAPGLDIPNPDPGEEYQHTNTQLYNILSPENRGKRARKMPSTNAPPHGQKASMDGFVTDYISNYEALRHRSPGYQQYQQIMQGHTPDQVPVLSTWPGACRVRPLVQRGAFPDVPQSLVLDGGHVVGPRRQRPGPALLLRTRPRPSSIGWRSAVGRGR